MDRPDTSRTPTATATSLLVSISGAAPAVATARPVLDCTRRPLHAPAAQAVRQADPDDVFADDNDDFVWIDLERMLAGREAARRLHPSFKG